MQTQTREPEQTQLNNNKETQHNHKTTLKHVKRAGNHGYNLQNKTNYNKGVKQRKTPKQNDLSLQIKIKTQLIKQI